MHEPLSDLAKGLKNQDKDTYIIGTIIICSFAAMIFRVPPSTALLSGCLFLGLYVVARYLLMSVRVRELQLLLRKDIGSEAEKLIEKYASPTEKSALAQISASKAKPRPKKSQKSPGVE